MQPIDLKFKHYKCSFSRAAHSIIYSKNTINNILENYNCVSTYIYGWDTILHNFLTKHYIYHKPLCYQLFPQTKNSTN